MKYITTPIYYANDAPHVGSAVTTLAADVLARFWRLQGEEAYFLTGTDEHGAKIFEAAQKLNETPQALVDRVSAQFTTTWSDLKIQHDGFIRTTNPEHKKFVQDFLQKLYDAGHIYKGEYTGWYCTGCEEFKTETQIGEGNTCPLHQTPLKEVSESAYLFKLSDYTEKLITLIESNELTIRPESRKNEVLSFIREGLRDVAVSRKNVAWGIEVPWDNSHTVYVWIDALLNYLSVTQAGVLDKSAPWPPTVQLIAKDILRFHGVIWPALLLAAGEQLPKQLFVHGYFTVDGQKMSKSLGNVIRPQELIDRYGVDGARYVLLAAVPFGADGDISLSRLDEIYNADLANNLGNLVNRVWTMIGRYCDGVVPNPSGLSLEHIAETQLVLDKLIEDVNLGELIEVLRRHVRNFNVYLQNEKPWELATTNREKLDVVLANCAEGLVALAIQLQPILPSASAKIIESAGTSNELVRYATLGKNSLVAGNTIKPLEPLFPRLDLNA